MCVCVNAWVLDSCGVGQDIYYDLACFVGQRMETGTGRRKKLKVKKLASKFEHELGQCSRLLLTSTSPSMFCARCANAICGTQWRLGFAMVGCVLGRLRDFYL